MLRPVLPALIAMLLVSACGCLAFTAQPAGSRGTDPVLPAPGVSDMKMGARVIAMAVCADEIGTPYPEAADLLIKSLHSNANGGRFSEAIDYYDRALAIDPGCSTAWLAKGVALHNLGRYDEAILCYERASALDPGNEGIALLKEMAEGDRVEEHDTV